VLGVFKNDTGGELTPPARRADQVAKGFIRKALKDLQGKTGSTLLLRELPDIAAERVLLVGLGERKEFGEAAYRDAVRGAASALRELGIEDAVLFLVDVKVRAQPISWNVRHAVLVFRDAFYRFEQLKTQKKSPPAALKSVTLSVSSSAALEQVLKEASATADGTALARTLGNLPPNICTPAYLAA